MSLNATPKSDRIHIGIFGMRNAGKSSVINAITGQDLAIVSDVLGTTTDPVSKAMEILPLGPVVVTDTPGLDDTGELGAQRVKKSYQVLNKTDIALLVVDKNEGLSKQDRKIIEKFKAMSIPYIVVYNKSDDDSANLKEDKNSIEVSCKTRKNIQELKEKIASLSASDASPSPIISDLITESELVVLVVPIDSAAPKGRLILPQQQTIRDILDAHAASIVVQPQELSGLLKRLPFKPAMVVTDSQAFAQVSKDTPEGIPLTSFSILFARHKGILKDCVKGVAAMNKLKENSRVLVCEGCSHHRQCDDIGTVKIPRWLKAYTHKNLDLTFVSGVEFPEDLSPYDLVVHCGGCMLNAREVQHRLRQSNEQGVPMTNYGTLIAEVTGILRRSLVPFEGYSNLLD